ncbi:MAG TPA: AbrB family transcriptional regulator [Clostridiales bacterium]|nr:AbrB family transcriptional regulator [Clostridiales bacterium]
MDVGGVETIKVGKRGTVVIPVALRQKYNIDAGTLLMAESRDEGILLRPTAVFPVEIYAPERKAQFLLNTAVTPEDYAWAAEEVRKLGFDPDRVSHDKR